MRKIGKIMVVSAALVSGAAHGAPEVVFTDGQTKVLVDYQKNKMFCTFCGFGEDMKQIDGPIPEFEGSLSGVDNYFKEKRILIVRSDRGVSCHAGSYTMINLEKRTSKEIALPSCNEADVTYSTEKGKAVMKVKQGRKVTNFYF